MESENIGEWRRAWRMALATRAECNTFLMNMHIVVFIYPRRMSLYVYGLVLCQVKQ